MSDTHSNEVFANNLNYYLVQKNLSPMQVSRIIEVPYYIVMGWVNAKRYPDTAALNKLVDFLDCDYRDLTDDHHYEKISTPWNSGPVAPQKLFGVPTTNPTASSATPSNLKNSPENKIKDDLKNSQTSEIKDDLDESPTVEVKDDLNDSPTVKVRDDLKNSPVNETKDETKTVKLKTNNLEINGDSKLKNNNEANDAELVGELVKLICQLNYADKQKALKTLKIIFGD